MLLMASCTERSSLLSLFYLPLSPTLYSLSSISYTLLSLLSLLLLWTKLLLPSAAYNNTTYNNKSSIQQIIIEGQVKSLHLPVLHTFAVIHYYTIYTLHLLQMPQCNTSVWYCRKRESTVEDLHNSHPNQTKRKIEKFGPVLVECLLICSYVRYVQYVQYVLTIFTIFYNLLYKLQSFIYIYRVQYSDLALKG